MPRHTRVLGHALFALALPLMTLGSAQATVSYRVTDLGSASSVAGPNNAGVVVGNRAIMVNDSLSAGEGFIYSAQGGTAPLATTAPQEYFLGINDAGQILTATGGCTRAAC